MTSERFKEKFSSGDDAFVVVPKEGDPYRPDGKPLTVSDRAILEDKDPLAASS